MFKYVPNVKETLQRSTKDYKMIAKVAKFSQIWSHLYLPTDYNAQLQCDQIGRFLNFGQLFKAIGNN